MFDRILNMHLNSTTSQRNLRLVITFSFSALINFYYVSSGLCLYGFTSSVTFTVTVKVEVVTTLLHIHYQISQLLKR